jgi:MFS family permease
MAQGRNEEALAILVKYHGFGNPDSRVVQLEYAEYVGAISTDGTDKRWWDFREIFRGKAALYRIFCVINLGILYQWSGNSLGIYYLPVMLGQAGIKNVHITLLVTCITSTVALCLALLGSWLLDKWGRKYSLMFALAGMAITLSILAGLQSPGPAMTTSETNASIAIIMLFRFTYALGMTPVEALYAIEMLPHAIRAKAQGLTSLILTAALFASTYASPVALQNIKWKYYLVFVGLDTMWFFVIWLLYPETKGTSFIQWLLMTGRTIEEMQAIFEAKNPVKASKEAARRAEL